MLKLQDFRDKGFTVTRCDKTSLLEADIYTWLCQKPIYERLDSHWGKRYFINVYVLDSRLVGMGQMLPYKRKHVIKLCFERGGLTFWMTVQQSRDFHSINDIELLCQEIWTQLDCDYYE